MRLRGPRGGRASLGTLILAPRPARFVAGGAGSPALSPREAGWGRLGTPPRCEYRGSQEPSTLCVRRCGPIFPTSVRIAYRRKAGGTGNEK